MTAMLIVFFTSAFFHEYLISGEFAHSLKGERAGLVGYVQMTLGGILGSRQGWILVSGLYKLLHSAIPDGRSWSKLGENGEQG